MGIEPPNSGLLNLALACFSFLNVCPSESQIVFTWAEREIAKKERWNNFPLDSHGFALATQMFQENNAIIYQLAVFGFFSFSKKLVSGCFYRPATSLIIFE